MEHYSTGKKKNNTFTTIPIILNPEESLVLFT